jgi:hypothetical protein
VTQDVRWAIIATFATGFEADLARAALEAAGILVMVKGPQVGLFGAGFQGAMGAGVELLVPAPEVARSLALLDVEGQTT